MSGLFPSKYSGVRRTTIDSLLQDEEEEDVDNDGHYYFPINIISPERGHDEQEQAEPDAAQHDQFPPPNNILAILAAALRKSLLVTCSVKTQDFSSMDIGYPTDVRHVSHVTFDRFNGFLGLPAELQPQLPHEVPSASVSIFGVSANSMQCSYDQRGNSVPTILLMMQKHLYSGGGLQAEGIFRINAENSKEEQVRNQLSKGFVLRGIDVHCLAGLIKAWFRELPTGVLDSLTAEQVMNCNTEEECTQLVRELPPIEVALLDWAINLMADVVQNEQLNKMNARNIAMVFAPNMTQMADPLTALIHAVQVMNLLKTLILKTLREREESSTTEWLLSSCEDSPGGKDEPPLKNLNRLASNNEKSSDSCVPEEPEPAGPGGNFLRSDTLDRLEKKFWGFKSKNGTDGREDYDSTSGRRSAVTCTKGKSDKGFEAEGGILNRLGFRKGVRRHPVFRLSKAG